MARSAGDDDRAWCCDNAEEGTLHSAAGDARIDGVGAGDRAQAAAAVAERLAALEAAAREQRVSLKRKREAQAAEASADTSNGASTDAPDPETLPKCGAGMLAHFFSQLHHFALRSVTDGGSDLQLYDAMRSPDRSLLSKGFFAAEGSLVIEQLLALPPAEGWSVVSILGTEQILSRLAPVLLKTDLAITNTDAPPCLVYSCTRAQLSEITSFKHSALSALAIVRRPSLAVSAAASSGVSAAPPLRRNAPPPSGVSAPAPSGGNAAPPLAGIAPPPLDVTAAPQLGVTAAPPLDVTAGLAPPLGESVAQWLQRLQPAMGMGRRTVLIMDGERWQL